MKSKKRHQSSSDDSEDSDDHQSSSSDSESEDSSASEHRYKKKKKRDRDSSDSDSDSEGQRRAKKRKHKKKKKKHAKRKRRSESVADSGSHDEDAISLSDGDDSPKKKHKQHNKHKRSQSSSPSEQEEERKERRLHSVVKERRSSEGERPPPTYYQYQRPASPAEKYVDDREREVMRFYRGSSKERRYQEQQYNYEQQRNERFDPYEKTHTPPYKDLANNAQYNPHNRGRGNQTRGRGKQTRGRYNKNMGGRDHNLRNPRYQGHKGPDEYHRRPREESFHPREDIRAGFNRYHNQYEDRSKRREFDDGRDYRERRGPPEPDRYRDREFPDRRERFREDPFHPDRARDGRREKPSPPHARPERPRPQLRPQPDVPPPLLSLNIREPPRPLSPEDRYRGKRPERDERNDRFRDERRERSRNDDIRPDNDRRPNDDRRSDNGRRPSDDRRPNERRPDDRRSERPRSEVKSEPRERERGKEKKSRFADADDKEYNWGKEDIKKEDEKSAGDKEKPNFGLSGKLTADANTVNGVVIKYTEPDDAKQPKRRWRFYPFKGEQSLPILYIHRQSAFLIGRDKNVCDITLEHPSISKQHSALQYRATPFTRDDGTQGRRVRPYIIDLESSNGTFVNNKKIEARRYVELLERDVVKFGFSAREYVLLHENSKDDAQDDDNEAPAAAAALGAAVTTTAQIKHEKRIKTEITEDGE